MKTSGIYSAFAFSIFLHALIAAAIFVSVRHSSLYKTPPAYIVTIVDDSASDRSIAPKGNVQDIPETETQPPKADEPKVSAKQKDIKTKYDDINVRERIEALQAKKMIEKMAALRKMVDVKSQESGVKSQESTFRVKSQGSGVNGQKYSGDYYSMVIDKIRQQWIFPESIDKDLLAIITIKIARDGSVTIDKMEKSSGNAMFDRSALRAINKASPLPPPPQEMEMGVRFMP